MKEKAHSWTLEKTSVSQIRKKLSWRLAGSGQTESQPSYHTGMKRISTLLVSYINMSLNNFDQILRGFLSRTASRAGHAGRLVGP